MWGLVKLGALVFLGYTFKDDIVEKSKEGADAVVSEFEELKKEGVEKYIEGAKETSSKLLEKGKKELDSKSDFTRRLVNKPTETLTNTVKDSLGLSSNDFNPNAKPEKKDDGIISTLWNKITGKDGLGLGGMAALGGGGLLSMVTGKWLLGRLFGGNDDKSDKNDNGGISFTGIALALAIAGGAYMYFGQDNENEANLLASDDTANILQRDRSDVNNSFANARDNVLASSNSDVVFKPKGDNAPHLDHS